MSSIGNMSKDVHSPIVLAPPLTIPVAPDASTAPNAAPVDTFEPSSSTAPQPVLAQENGTAAPAPRAKGRMRAWLQDVWIALCTKLFGRR